MFLKDKTLERYVESIDFAPEELVPKPLGRKPRNS